MTDTPPENPPDTPPDEDTPQDEDKPQGPPGGDATLKPRDGTGSFTRSIETAKRDAQIAEDRSRSMTWRQIGAKHGISLSAAHEAYTRALAEVIVPAAENARKTELEKLDRAEARVLAVLERQHVTVSHGRLITQDGEPVADDGPAMQAAAMLVRISESRRKLLGLDAPAQVVTDSTVKYEVVGIDPADLA